MCSKRRCTRINIWAGLALQLHSTHRTARPDRRSLARSLSLSHARGVSARSCAVASTLGPHTTPMRLHMRLHTQWPAIYTRRDTLSNKVIQPHRGSVHCTPCMRCIRHSPADLAHHAQSPVRMRKVRSRSRCAIAQGLLARCLPACLPWPTRANQGQPGPPPAPHLLLASSRASAGYYAPSPPHTRASPALPLGLH